MSGDKEIDVNTVLISGIDVARHRAHHLEKHRRTAGALVPCPARACRITLERVLIEIRISMERDSREGSVIKRSLQFVGVTAVAECYVHIVVEKSGADGSAGLQICVVGQRVVWAEFLFIGKSSDAPGDMHPAIDHVLPQANSSLTIGFSIVH